MGAGTPRRAGRRVPDRPGDRDPPRSASSQRSSSASGRARCVVDVSLYETAIGYVGYHLGRYLADVTVLTGEGTRFPMVQFYDVMATRDGELMAGGNDRLFRAICDVLGLPQVVDDERFRTNPDRAKPGRADGAASNPG